MTIQLPKPLQIKLCCMCESYFFQRKHWESVTGVCATYDGWCDCGALTHAHHFNERVTVKQNMVFRASLMTRGWSICHTLLIWLLAHSNLWPCEVEGYFHCRCNNKQKELLYCPHMNSPTSVSSTIGQCRGTILILKLILTVWLFQMLSLMITRALQLLFDICRSEWTWAESSLLLTSSVRGLGTKNPQSFCHVRRKELMIIHK